MLLYYLFWMLMGFILHFNIIFGTNLLIGGLAQIAVFVPISVFRRKRITESKWNETFGSVIVGTNVIQRTWSGRQAINEEARRQGRASLPHGLLASSLTSTPSPLDHVCSKNNSPEGFIPFGLRLIFLFYETLK